MAAELLVPVRPPLSVFSEVKEYEAQLFEARLACHGPLLTWKDWILKPFMERKLSTPEEVSTVSFEFESMSFPFMTIGKPKGTATFLKSDIEQFDRDFGLQSGEPSMHEVLQWLNYVLGATCGVGLAYTDSNPHIRLYCLPQSKMRGAIGWTWGPPLARNRTMQYSRDVRAAYYRLRLAQHEFGHFLGHYGWPSHSNSKSDIMYPSLQHIKAHSPNWGYSERDIAWAIKTFGPAWIQE